MKPIITLILALLITACASHDGRGLKPGVSNLDEVVQFMGEPAMRWQEPDGGQLLAYPRGPAGFNTFMVTIGPDGRMTSLHGVLNMKTFALIREGMTQEQVLRILGPSVAAWTIYFERRDELVWEWRYCDPWNEPARFNVLFDNTTKKVRTTQGYPEGKRFREWCGNELQ